MTLLFSRDQWDKRAKNPLCLMYQTKPNHILGMYYCPCKKHWCATQINNVIFGLRHQYRIFEAKTVAEIAVRAIDILVRRSARLLV